MRINNLIELPSLLSNCSITIGLGNIPALFNRVIHTASENSRKDLQKHTAGNRKNTLKVQEKRKHALMDHNSIQTRALKDASFFRSYIALRETT